MRRTAVVAAILVSGAAFGVVVPAAACAGESPSAALVVDTGDATYRYCVAFDGPSVSGIELIQLAGEQHGLQYRLDAGGRAVCMLANVGASGDDCFGSYPDFWGYWRGDGSGGWDWSSTGAASTEVGDGDVEGWSWGSGQDGSSHPQPPPTVHGDVCEPLQDPSNGDDGASGERSDSTAGPGRPPRHDSAAGSTEGEQMAAATRPAGAPVGDDRDLRPAARSGRTKIPPVTAPVSPVAPSGEGAMAGASDRGADQGPGMGGIAALVSVIVLGAGAVAARRRRGDA